MSNPLEYTFFTSEIQQKVHEMAAMLPLEGHLPSTFLRAQWEDNRDPYHEQVQYFCLEPSSTWSIDFRRTLEEDLNSIFSTKMTLDLESSRKAVERVVLILKPNKEEAIVELLALGVDGEELFRRQDWRKDIEKSLLNFVDILLEKAVRCEFTGLTINYLLVKPGSMEVKLQTNLQQIIINFQGPSFPQTVGDAEQHLNQCLVECLSERNKLIHHVKISQCSPSLDLPVYVQHLKWQEKIKFVFLAASYLRLVIFKGQFRAYKLEVYANSICHLIDEGMQNIEVLKQAGIADLAKEIVEEDQVPKIVTLFEMLALKINQNL